MFTLADDQRMQSQNYSGPADNLVGMPIADGWVITKKLPKPGSEGAEDLTGSFFSIGYIASKDKTEAFLKVVDVEHALRMHDTGMPLIERLKLVTDSHSFECSVLDICQKAKLDRIVRILLKGELSPLPGSFIPIPYILFELADGDVRKIVSRTNKIDDAWRLHVLHDTAVGLQQLHSQQIAHQDLKPSNVLVFEQDKKRAKIGDLGRASRRGTEASHDGTSIPGAILYAPPEQIYGQIPERWEDRRESCDLYHLGTLMAYMFAGTTPTDYYIQALGAEIRPHYWQGTGKSDYKTALPLLQSAFTSFIAQIQQDFPAWAAVELSTVLLHACHPDYEKRGDPSARARVGQPIGIETFVSRFDRLARRAEIEIRR